MNIIRKFVISLGLLAMGAALASCAVEAIPYPKLSTIKKLKTKILSREEQDEVMQSLAADQEQHQKSAINEIEKKP